MTDDWLKEFSNYQKLNSFLYISSCFSAVVRVRSYPTPTVTAASENPHWFLVQTRKRRQRGKVRQVLQVAQLLDIGARTLKENVFLWDRSYFSGNIDY